MRILSLCLVVATAASLLAACVSSTSQDASSAEAEVTSLSLRCTYGNAEFDVTGGAGALHVSGQSIAYSCAAPTGTATAGEVLACAEASTTLHSGVWSFVVSTNGSGYTATLQRPGSADIAFACSASGASIDAGPGPGADASAADAGPAHVDASSGPTWAEAGPILHATCDGCHHDAFTSLATVKQNKSRMVQLISSGRMPKNQPGWADTADGKLVLDFLQNGSEVQ